MSFVSGFAEGYINERNRRIKRTEDQDDMSFEYRMKYLTDQREKREAKKLKETELGSQAKLLASQLNDPDAAADMYQELAVGKISYEEMQKRIQQGYYQKNEDFVEPTRTVKVPRGVVPASGVMAEPLDAQFPKNERVDKRIDAIDPTLRQAPAEDNTYSEFAEGKSTGRYIFKPTNEEKIPSLVQVQSNLQTAMANGDPVAIRKAEDQLKAYEITATMSARTKAKAEQDASVRTYIQLDKFGKAKSTFPGRQDGDDLWNISTDQIVQRGDDSKFIPISDEQLKLWYNASKEVGAKSSDLRSTAANYTAALDTAQKITTILAKNRDVATYVASGYRIAADLEGEARAIYEQLNSQKAEIEADLMNGTGGNIEAKVAQYQNSVMDFLAKTETPQGVIGNKGHELARAKAQYDSLMTTLTFQMAAANGISASKMSDQDFKNTGKMIGVERTNAQDVLMAIQNTFQTVLTKVDSERKLFNNQPLIRDLPFQLGFNPDFEVPRIEQLLEEQGRQDLVGTFRMLKGDTELQRLNAVQDAQEQQDLNVPGVGTEVDGYVFQGGDPADPNNWKNIKVVE